MAKIVAPTSKVSHGDCRAKAVDTIAKLYDELLDIENHPKPVLTVDNSIMRFIRLILLGLSDILINLPEKEG